MSEDSLLDLEHVGNVRRQALTVDEHTSSSRVISVYCFRTHPEAFFIPSLLTSYDEAAIASKCLYDYAAPPNRTNLSPQSCNENASPENRHVFRKLRWVSLGHQYNWTKRSYDDEQEFPEALRHLGSFAIDIVNEARRHDPAVEPLHIESDTALINFYRSGDRLRGHRDDVEMNKTAALVSVSIGLPAIFLLGHDSRSKTPIPVCVKGRDCIILSGRARLAYHGVPRLLAYQAPAKCNTKESEDELRVVADQIQDSRSSLPFFSSSNPNIAEMNDILSEVRINISLRQHRE